MIFVVGNLHYIQKILLSVSLKHIYIMILKFYIENSIIMFTIELI